MVLRHFWDSCVNDLEGPLGTCSTCSLNLVVHAWQRQWCLCDGHGGLARMALAHQDTLFHNIESHHMLGEGPCTRAINILV